MNDKDTIADAPAPKVYDLNIDLCTPGSDLLIDAVDVDGKTEFEPAVDRALDRFAEFYLSKLDNGKLSAFERSAIKTFLYWHTHPQLKVG
jgi:hypothetical protein